MAQLTPNQQDHPAPAGGFCLQLAESDVGELFRGRLGLKWNELSPFAESLAAHVPGTAKLGPAAAAVARHPLFHKVASILTRPDVRVAHRYAGRSGAPNVFTAYCSRGADQDAIAVVLPSAEDARLIRLFGSTEEYHAWWLNLLASKADEPGTDNPPLSLPLEALVYWLHAIDLYRRATYQRMLSYNAPKAASVEVAEFVEAMGKSIGSRDTQWLLPSFLLLTPGLRAGKLEPRLAHLRALADRGSLIPGKSSQSQKQVFFFGDSLAAIGDEFIGGVDVAVGLEIAVWTERGGLPIFEGFLAPTTRANHLIEIQPGANGAGLAIHRALTQRQLYGKLIGLLSAALHPGAPGLALRRALPAAQASAPSKPGPSTETAAVTCKNCGLANPAKMKFCGECGGSLVESAARVRTIAASPSIDGVPAGSPTPSGTKALACPSCRKPVPSNSRFCSSCGTKISIDPPATAPTAAAVSGKTPDPRPAQKTGEKAPSTQTPASRRCSNKDCGRIVPPGKKFCTACGTRVA